MERTRKAIQTSPEVRRNLATGRAERTARSNIASVSARAAAILASIREAPNLRLLADVREIPAKLAAMRASWPPIGDTDDAGIANDSEGHS